MRMYEHTYINIRNTSACLYVCIQTCSMCIYTHAYIRTYILRTRIHACNHVYLHRYITTVSISVLSRTSDNHSPPHHHNYPYRAIQQATHYHHPYHGQRTHIDHTMIAHLRHRTFIDNIMIAHLKSPIASPPPVNSLPTCLHLTILAILTIPTIPTIPTIMSIVITYLTVVSTLSLIHI